MQSGGSQPVIQVSLCVSGLFELPPAEEVLECRIFFFRGWGKHRISEAYYVMWMWILAFGKGKLAMSF